MTQVDMSRTEPAQADVSAGPKVFLLADNQIAMPKDSSQTFLDYRNALSASIEAGERKREAAIAEGRATPNADVTPSDQAAAAKLNGLANTGANWRQSPAFRAISLSNATDTGSVLTCAFAILRAPGWAAAAGVNDDILASDDAWLLELIRTLLICRVNFTAAQHRVLLQGLIEHYRGENHGIQALEDRILEWINENPGVNLPEIRSLFEVTGCKGSLADVAVKLRKRTPKVLLTLFEAASVLLTHREELHNRPDRTDAAVQLFVGGYRLETSWHHSQWQYDSSVRSEFGLHPGRYAAAYEDLSLLKSEPEAMPTAAELAWFADYMRLLPRHEVSGLLLHVVTQLLRVLRFPHTEPVYGKVREAANMLIQGEKARIFHGACGLIALEQTILDHWPLGKDLLAHLDSASGSKPSAKWLKELARLVPKEMRGDLASAVKTAVDNSAFDRSFKTGMEARLKGFVWATALCDAAGVAPLLTSFALSFCYQSTPGVGMRDEALGNACAVALINMPEAAGIPYLARLLARVKYPKVKKQIERALDEAATKAGMTRGQLDEISVPTHDLDAQGRREVAVGGGAALIAIEGTESVALTWRTPDGNTLKSLPASLKDTKADIKAVRVLVKEIETDLGIQPWRIQRLWLEDRRWTAGAWQQRYVEHPLIGALSRRLIWNAYVGEKRVAGIWQNGALADLAGRPIPLDDARISLWHPVGCEVAEVVAWRERLGALGIVQPFKQAHREVYIVTDAEQRTDTYSNRFAGHLIKQHQMQALARLNGWSMTVHVGYDGGMANIRPALPCRMPV
jgi:hypothetical protein